VKEATMEVNIHPIPAGFDTIYALRGKGVILIDGGDPKYFGKVKHGIERASIKPEEILLIILTHGHWDHIGSAKDIKNWTRAKLMLHQRDLHLLEDSPPIQPPGFTAWGKIIIALLNLYTPHIHIPRFEVDIVAGDEDISLAEFGIPGKVVYTPGHSWGSVSILLDSGEAFVGDLAMNMLPMRLTPGLAVFGDDIQILKKSWRKLLDMGARMMYPAHGKPFPVEKLYMKVA
jgi:glyoxylase-like metal-dependent hydrolase (beta-lactamase superfamily II)